MLLGTPPCIRAYGKIVYIIRVTSFSVITAPFTRATGFGGATLAGTAAGALAAGFTVAPREAAVPWAT
jgi:hypothetical protein